MPSPITMLGVIQARMSSRRFPGKVLRQLQGVPMLVFLIRHIQNAAGLDQLVVATSDNPADDAILETLRSYQIPVVRGPEDDVLTRYLNVLDQFPARYVIRITADNPLSDPELLAFTMHYMQAHNLAYAYMRNVPVGTACDIFQADLLRFMGIHAETAFQREHINAYVIDHPADLRWEFLDPPDIAYRRPDLSFTIDTPAEFAWVESVLARLPQGSDASLVQLIAAADAFRSIASGGI